MIKFIYLDMLDGCLLARDGHIAEAEAAAERVLRQAEGTDFVDVRASAGRHVAEILHRVGRLDESKEQAVHAIAIAEARGDVVLAAMMRRELARVGVEVA